MSILSDLGLLKPSPPVRTAGSMLLLNYDYGKQIGVYEPKTKVNMDELIKLKMRLVVKNAMEAGLVDVDKLNQIIKEASAKNNS